MRKFNLNHHRSKFISLLVIKCFIRICCAVKSGPCTVRKFPHDHEIWDSLLMTSDTEDYYSDLDVTQGPSPEEGPFGDRPSPEEVPFGDRLPPEEGPFGDRPSPEEGPFGDRPSPEEGPFGDRPSPEEGPFLEGDIIPSASTVHYSHEGLRWPNATVPFQFHNMMSYNGRVQVLRAMNEYHAHTCIQFKKRRGERDYLVIGSSYHWVCASSVGRQGGAQLLHLGPACTRSVGTPMHELMHAIGFFHEHMRPDRDKYVYINYSNIDEALWKNFREVHPSSLMSDLGAGYDFESLMHYRICAMTNSSWPTIMPKIRAKLKLVGQRKGFSKKDVIKINTFYNCSSHSRKPKMFAVDFNHSKSKNMLNKNSGNRRKSDIFEACIALIIVAKYTSCLIYSHCCILLPSHKM